MEDFVNKSIENINKWNPNILSSGYLKLLRKISIYSFYYVCPLKTCYLFLKVGDGRNGYPDDGPYQAIHVGSVSLKFSIILSFIQQILNLMSPQFFCYYSLIGFLYLNVVLFTF